MPVSQNKNGGYNIALYRDKKADESDAVKAVAKLKAVYPARMTPEFVAVLCEYIVEEGMTKKQLSDSVRNIITKGDAWNIADVVGYRKSIKVYTYSEMTAMCNSSLSVSPFEEMEKLYTKNGKCYWVKRDDLLLANPPIDLQRLRTYFIKL